MKTTVSDTLNRLQRQFVSQLPSRIDEIRDHLQQLDPSAWQQKEKEAVALRHLVHTLTGSAGTFGLRSVSNAARALEILLSNLATTKSSPSVAEWQDILRKMERLDHMASMPFELNSWNKQPPPTPQRINSAPLIHLVEDDPAQAKYLSQLLQEEGYRVQVFSQPDEFRSACVAIDGEQPAAVVMDMIFPEGEDTGADLISSLGLGMEAGIPVVITSVRDDLRGRLAAFRAGASRYLVKPIEASGFILLLDELTSRQPPQPYRVLLVDDDPLLLDVQAAVLDSAGMIVQTLSQPLKTLESIDQFTPDVVVLDVYMPEVSGPELAAILREREGQAHMPILFLSTETNMTQQLLALNLGGNDFLVKPVHPDHLVAAVVTRAHRARQNRVMRQHLETTLYEREREHLALNQHAIVSITDHLGNITYANDLFCKISGYSLEKLLGQNHRIINSGYHPPEFFKAMWNTIAHGEIWQGEICNRREDGSIYWVSSTITPFLFTNGKPYQYVSIRTDITHMKAAESTLRWQSSMHRMISEMAAKLLATPALEMSATINHVLKISGKHIGADHAYLSLISESDRMMDNTLEWCAPGIEPRHNMMIDISLSAASWWREEIERKDLVIIPDVASMPPEAAVEKEILESQGVRSHCSLMLKKSGKIWGLIGYDSIVKQHKWTRDEVEQLTILGDIISSALAQQQAEEALINAHHNADLANRAKSEFLSSMSHELRTPMNAILGFTQLLEYDSSLNEDQQDNVHEISQAGDHLLELINEVLDLAKIESGNIEFSLESTEVSPLIEECLRLMETLAKKRNIHLSHSGLEGIAVRADHTRLKQALLNLFSNAIKYNRDGGKVKIDAQPINQNQLRIRVQDTGPGIATEHTAALFKPFSRLNAENSDIEGTGIGLTITQRIIEMMGGTLGVDSEVGVGSCFWIELPIAPLQNPIGKHEAVPRKNTALPQESGVARYTILYIEDNPANLKLVEQLLDRRRHIQLLSAHNPKQGIDLAITHTPDLILLDINLAGMDGYQVLEVLKTDAVLKHVPTVAITANAMSNDIARGIAAGFSDYMTKPIDVSNFLEIIDQRLPLCSENTS